MTTEFKSPKLSQEFYNEVIDRCYKLIEINYWDRIDNSTLDDWLNNFKTDEEKYFASQVLFNFQYRNHDAMISMFKQIIQIYLPQKLAELNIYKISSIKKWEQDLATGRAFSFPFRFSTIDKEDKIGTSGHALFRLFAQNGLINKEIGRIINSEMDKKVKTIILVDDIAGTGTQFDDFYTKYKDSFDKFKHIIYCPLVAHEDAIEKIQKIGGNIHIIPAEILTKKKHSFFKISDELNSNEKFQDFYQQIINKLGMKDKFGFSSQAILYGLNISTPNNNLPIIYYSNNWSPLLKR